jgi:hypothetical protein
LPVFEVTISIPWLSLKAGQNKKAALACRGPYRLSKLYRIIKAQAAFGKFIIFAVFINKGL